MRFIVPTRIQDDRLDALLTFFASTQTVIKDWKQEAFGFAAAGNYFARRFFERVFGVVRRTGSAIFARSRSTSFSLNNR